MNERGFTLIETIAVVSIGLILMLAAIPLTNGARSAAAAAAAAQFDAAVAYAKSLAGSSGNGATLVVGMSAIVVYSGRPTFTNALQPSGMAPFGYNGTISEATAGSAPFSIFFDTAGNASAAAGAIAPGNVLPAQPHCPGSGALTVTIADMRTSSMRTLACETAAALP